MTAIKQKNRPHKKEEKQTYKKFSSINGNHPLKKVTNDAYIEYKVRTRKGAKVRAFNFDLAKEVGLIDSKHSHCLNPELEKAIIDTFGIVIINEYDIENNKEFDPKDIRPNKYMATRYLQLQHPKKDGSTSGDGRSIWNGVIRHKGKIWDVSSCGTGATSLSPATHIQGKFFETGDPTISYGCGYAEVDEGFTSLFFSEVLHKNHVPTERVLCVLQFPDGYAVNVRVHDNLLRPSHFFNHLKQGNQEALKSMVDYYIDRQIQNKIWSHAPQGTSKRYQFFLRHICETFAKVSALFEDEYIFCWMDWDGDNILMDGSIIDYGSVRQFGLFHHEYRFDDVERFSTTITEQKLKAKLIVQTFIQAIDFIQSGQKKNIKSFSKHALLDDFNATFEQEKRRNLVYKLGFPPRLIESILKKSKQSIREFEKTFRYFERSKSLQGKREVADGVNWDAIFCMRDILREYPQYLLNEEEISDEEFIAILKSKYATKEDVELSTYRKKQISMFKKYYKALVDSAASCDKSSTSKILLEMTMRSSIINKFDRITGDSITHIVDYVLSHKKESDSEEIFSILTSFVDYQNFDPREVDKSVTQDKKNIQALVKMKSLVQECREGL